MHTPQEPEKYLRRNFEGEYSVSGVPFLEGTSLLNDTNLIIYGHNMKNGTMFSEVTKYREKDFCVKHPYIEFETKDGLKCYDVFAVVCVKKTDNWYKFSYAENEEQYRDKITEIKKRSIYDTGIVPEYGQQLINRLSHNQRIVIKDGAVCDMNCTVCVAPPYPKCIPLGLSFFAWRTSPQRQSSC